MNRFRCSSASRCSATGVTASSRTPRRQPARSFQGRGDGGPDRPALRGRDALGARVAVTASNGRTIWRRVHTDGSYASASDPRVLVGLGDTKGSAKVRVIWPDGKSENFDGIA